MGQQLAGCHSSWCPELESRTTQSASDCTQGTLSRCDRGSIAGNVRQAFAAAHSLGASPKPQPALTTGQHSIVSNCWRQVAVCVCACLRWWTPMSSQPWWCQTAIFGECPTPAGSGRGTCESSKAQHGLSCPAEGCSSRVARALAGRVGGHLPRQHGDGDPDVVEVARVDTQGV